jgi:hypothetical protein
MNADPIIGRRLFTDGATRDVFADREGQYVIGDGAPAGPEAARWPSWKWANEPGRVESVVRRRSMPVPKQ